MNQLTRALEINSKLFIMTDEIFKEWGKMPYGMVEATPKEQREEFNKLTSERLRQLVQTQGEDAVNEYLQRMMQGGK